MKQYRLSTALLCLLLVVSLLSTTALAYGRIDTEQETQLTIAYRDSDVSFRIYQVATVSDAAYFTLTGSFAAYTDLQPKVDAGDWDALVLTLESRVARDGIQPLASGKTDKDGDLKFPDLQTGLYLVLGQTYVRGKTVTTPEPFLVSLPDLDSSDQWQYRVTVYPKPDDLPPSDETGKTSIHVKKLWENGNSTDPHPESVTVGLYKNDKLEKTVTLSKDNNWQHTWTGLTIGPTWTVAELNVPDGYDDDYKRNGDTVYIINTYDEDTPVSPTGPTDPTNPGGGSGGLPQTGLLWWPIPLLTIGGILLFLTGWVKSKKQGDAHETEP